jgi:hypothetical protein
MKVRRQMVKVYELNRCDSAPLLPTRLVGKPETILTLGACHFVNARKNGDLSNFN